MVKRALLIGASSSRLRGVEANLGLMRGLLEEYGFEDFVPTPRPATREAILGGLRRLAERTRPGDATVVYYCGHGGLARFDGDPSGRLWRYLVPSEGPHSARSGRFHALLDVELHALLGAEIGRRSPNLTFIVESCFAGGMYTPFTPPAARATVEVARFSGRPPIGLEPPSQAAAVVVVAATSEARKAYESHAPPYHGFFTAALAEVLRRYRGRRTSWARVIAEVRELVRRRRGLGDQEPHVIGPEGRIVFEMDSWDTSLDFAVERASSAPMLLGGRLQALATGDELELLDDEGASLGGAAIAHAGLDRARLSALDDAPERAKRAVLRRRRAALEVTLRGRARRQAELEHRIRASPWLQLREVSEASGGGVRVHGEGGRLVARGPGLYRRSWPLDVVGRAVELSPAAWIVAELEALARGRVVLSELAKLPPPPAGMDFWLQVHGPSGLRRLPATGARVVLRREQVNAGMSYARKYTGETMFVNLVNHGVDDRLSLLNANVYNRGGFDLFGEAPDELEGQSRALSLVWPQDVPRRPARDALYFVVSEARLDLPLNVQLASAGPSRARSSTSADPSCTREPACHVQRLEFTLCP